MTRQRLAEQKQGQQDRNKITYKLQHTKLYIFDVWRRVSKKRYIARCMLCYVMLFFFFFSFFLFSCKVIIYKPLYVMLCMLCYFGGLIFGV